MFSCKILLTPSSLETISALTLSISIISAGIEDIMSSTSFNLPAKDSTDFVVF